MLMNQLLDEIRKGGTLRPSELARRLDVGVDLVRMMLEDLEARGWIMQIGGCSGTCGGCPLDGACSGSDTGQVWMLVN